MKDQKVSTILGTIILVIIAATVAGFVLICFNNYPVEDNVKSIVIPVREMHNEDNVKSTVIPVREINNKNIEDELWNQWTQESKVSNPIKENFHIGRVNENETIALGSHKNNCEGHCGGANIFAFRTTPNEKWTIQITQEYKSCSDIEMLSNDQIKFINQYSSENCAEYYETGKMHVRKILKQKDITKTSTVLEEVDTLGW